MSPCGRRLERLQPSERQVLVEHELDGRDTKSLAADLRSTPGAIAAQLNRTRAKLRVEYLLETHGDPPSPQCRPVLLALSAGDRRRQAALRAGDHLLDCNFCAALSEPLLDRRSKPAVEDTAIAVRVDADIVIARQRGRRDRVQAGFSDDGGHGDRHGRVRDRPQHRAFRPRRRGHDRARLRRRGVRSDGRRPETQDPGSPTSPWR